MLSNTGSVRFAGPRNSRRSLTSLLEPANPSGWTALFGVTAQPNANPIWFDLEVVYDPAAGGVGVTLPVAVESFASLSLGTVESQVDGSVRS